MQTETLERKFESQPFDSHERLYYDTATWAAEVLDGNMRTSFEYNFDGSELYASDGSPLRPIFEDAIDDAERLAEQNPNLAFEKGRRLIELDEYEEMLDMAAGHGPNTMVVVSEYPGELNDAEEDAGGYNHRRKQTMLRVISRTEEGKIRITSQSLDKSDRDGLEAIYAFFGQTPNRGSMLGQRIREEIDEDRQELLPDELTREYDRTIEAKFGGQYYAGRTPAERENTYDFVIDQTDLLEAFMTDPAEDNKLGFIAEMDNRWQKDKKFKPARNLSPMGSAMRIEMVRSAMDQQAMLARQENKTYSGCGMTLNAGNIGSQLDALGYGNMDKEKLSWHGGEIKDGKCVNCNEETKVGKENWCKSCISGHCGSK
jgi:hypothetical protein